MVKLLRDEGYTPVLKPGDTNATSSIVFKASGNTLYLYFYGCKDGSCERALLSNAFEFPKDKSGLAKKFSDWNSTKYTQAYDSADGVNLDAPYLLTGGYTKANFIAWLDLYLADYSEFEKQLY